eukprot:GHVQ01023799.1.p1 GENE.GHVQ01023799.1~~GHVQ01023799.1.p1  ORF type:complete len:230 (+),score=13.69 GHVQ01023799.1:583-1272(+)
MKQKLRLLVGVMVPPKLKLSEVRWSYDFCATTPLFVVLQSGVETQFCTNHLGHFLLTVLLLKNIKSSNGRIVNVSSMAHGLTSDAYEGFSLCELENVTSTTYDPQRFYGISKISNILFTKELQRRLSESSSGATAYCLHPGAVKSDLYRHVTILSRKFYNPLAPLVEQLLLKSTEAGTFTHLYLALTDKNELQPGAYYTDCRIGLTLTAANNQKLATDLWTWSEKWWNL